MVGGLLYWSAAAPPPIVLPPSGPQEPLRDLGPDPAASGLPVRSTETLPLRASVISYEGPLSLTTGASCEGTLDVDSYDGGVLGCRVMLRCAGAPLLGAPVHAPCERSPAGVIAIDPQPSSGDGDPFVNVDTPERILVLRDDGASAFRLTATM